MKILNKCKIKFKIFHNINIINKKIKYKKQNKWYNKKFNKI